jgi:hypothetical protein
MGMKKICFILIFVLGLLVYMPPAQAQYDIAGWWSGKGTYQQGDFVTGDWVALQARGKKASYLYIFQGPTSNTGTAYFLIWDDISSDYLLEIYDLFIKNNIFVLYFPTFFDPTTEAPAGATIILRPFGSASTVTSMSGYYTLYDLEATGSPDLFVRMGPVLFTRVLVSKVPEKAMEKVPFP